MPVVLLCAATVAVWLAWPRANPTKEPPVRSQRPSVPTPPPQWAKVDREQVEEAAKHRVPVAFENHLGMRFVLIPAGTFRMGSPLEEDGRRADETRHEITLSNPFYIQITEVTNAQFRRCDVWRVGRDHDSGRFRGRSLDGDDQPAVLVSWDTASEFADWLSNEDGPRRYGLPTEAQWEFACRGRSASPYWWGSSLDDGWRNANANDPETIMWLCGWPQDDGHRVTAPAASYAPNPWGLYDMAGNVWEWCVDWYGPYPAEPVKNPRGPPHGRARVLRGGSWLFGPALARSAARVRDGSNARSMNVGFRLVSPLPEAEE